MFRTFLRCGSRRGLCRGLRRGWRRGCERARPLSVTVPVLAFVVASFLVASPIGISLAAGGEVALDLDQAVQRAREASALVRRARAQSQLTVARRVEASI